ncbi:phospholipase D-like domain-containing protein [Cellulomonas massiliensis]|uniref:phospholipase D-like domain-containing protein n=1 Tax=Cellulomonas massiliensis TaxID=1465811 RepID=UPI0003696DE7|nr:phospholipase D-like domain-containing protein [Cellulomonas massiliensis]
MPSLALPGTRTARLVAALLVTVTALALVAAPAEATLPAGSVSVSVSKKDFISGDAVLVSGKVAGARVTTARLERKVGSSWRRIASVRTSSTGVYKFRTVLTGTADVPLRVRADASSTRRAATSAVRTVPHFRCTQSVSPTRGVAMKLLQPGPGAAARSAAHLKGVLCATSSRATVRVSLYLLAPDDASAATLLRTLEYLHRERKVTVAFLLERTGTGAMDATARRLRSFAQVTVCDRGCANGSGTDGAMHNKVVAISDTRWRSGVDRAVVLSSANWSDRQLGQYWQTVVTFHQDDRLYAAHLHNFDYQRACATGCRTALKPVVDTDAGRGTQVSFFPQDGDDNVVDLLDSVGCVAGSKIEVAMYIASPSRSRAISRALARLVHDGCSVRLVMSRSGIYANDAEVRRTLAASGARAMRCTDLMHGKFLVMRDVVLDGRPGQTLVSDGSQNWTFSGLRTNDDATFVLSTAGASSVSRARIVQVAQDYVDAWRAVYVHGSDC